TLISYASNLPKGSIGATTVFELDDEISSYKSIDLAIIAVAESRNGNDLISYAQDFDAVRRSTYQLYSGNWNLTIADLGTLRSGESVQDTYYLLEQLVKELHQHHVLPLVLGGSQDLMYPIYRSFDHLPQMVNVLNVDHLFDLGDIEAPLCNRNFIGKMVVEEPYHLFNYCNLGYQTYYSSQEEIELLDSMHFDALRLGKLDHDLKIVEPYIRDSDIVGVDLGCLDYGSSAFAKALPNGVNGKQLCSIARYAGMSDRVKTMGFFEMPRNYSTQGTGLISQALWYFMEGLSLRSNEMLDLDSPNFLSYEVLSNQESIKFVKSCSSGRWWFQMTNSSDEYTIRDHHAFIPCAESEYLMASRGEVPERWLRAKMKMHI
ncbi:MAG: formimidoylglutamase, partial [Nonlabens sp.]